ncbi:hypothetical protein R1sor_023313 [Riccia sorocarpa]|uniref:O-fucosyltransferase family protein n=1 Tax=Riccia sorocarpa TaxID=122646 RepID=A0ABD3GMB3_9MARC
MARGRSKLKLGGLPALSSVALVCGSALLVLALLSIVGSRVLDVERFHYRKEGAPFHVDDWRSSQVQPEKKVVTFHNELPELRDVPRQADSTLKNVWTPEYAEFYYGCSDPSDVYISQSKFEPNGYIMIAASGGLNQQRTGITDSVVVARILNATLVVPVLDHKSYWHDPSNFSDIFDVYKFISALTPDVTVIKELPLNIEDSVAVYPMRIPRKATPIYYENRVLPKLLSRQVIKLTKFDYRLSNRLENDLQKLRCRVNYHALHFTSPIAQMGQILVERMRRLGGRYIALHLRYEPDMLAFSGCYYGGGDKERKELGTIRKRWKTLHNKNPDKERRNGKCPLTPTEVGLMLRALGFGEDVHLYVASGDVYGGEATLAPLKALFPNYYTKESLATKEELAPFQGYSSRMAAIDYIVCDESDAFVANNNGNMARILAGHRRYNGHKRTIRPNPKKLSPLFITRETLGWEEFAAKVRHHQKGFMGDPNEVRPGRGEFHENPAACICEKPNSPVLKPSWEKTTIKKQAKPEGKAEVNVEDDRDIDGEDVGIDTEDDIVTAEFAGEDVLVSDFEDSEVVDEIPADEIPAFTD